MVMIIVITVIIDLLCHSSWLEALEKKLSSDSWTKAPALMRHEKEGLHLFS